MMQQKDSAGCDPGCLRGRGGAGRGPNVHAAGSAPIKLLNKTAPPPKAVVGMEAYDDSLVEPIELRMIRASKFAVRQPDGRGSPELEGLKDSIRQHGLLQPIVVRPLEHGFEIVAGHRRFAACRSLRWRFLPCRIREIDDRRAYEIQLSENLQRKTMDPLEEAEAFERYVVDFGWGGVTDLGRRIGRSEEYVSHRMQLLKLPDALKKKVTAGELGPSQAVEITGADPSIRAELIDSVTGPGAGRMTVRQIRLAKSELAEKAAEKGQGSRARPRAGLDEVERAEPPPRQARIVKRSSLALKVALSRIDDLIEDAHKERPRERAELIEFLMDLRRRTHAMIDDAVRYGKSCGTAGGRGATCR